MSITSRVKNERGIVKMIKLRKMLALTMIVAVVLLNVTGCEKKSDQPEPPTKNTVTEDAPPAPDLPAGEHPK